MGGVPGVKPAKVLVIGAGVVGYSAARIAAGMGADVTITDLSLSRLRHIDEINRLILKRCILLNLIFVQSFLRPIW